MYQINGIFISRFCDVQIIQIILAYYILWLYVLLLSPFNLIIISKNCLFRMSNYTEELFFTINNLIQESIHILTCRVVFQHQAASDLSQIHSKFALALVSHNITSIIFNLQSLSYHHPFCMIKALQIFSLQNFSIIYHKI